MRIRRSASTVLASVAIALIAAGCAQAGSHTASKRVPASAPGYWFTAGQDIGDLAINAGSAAISPEIARNFDGPGIAAPANAYTWCGEVLLGAQAAPVKRAVKQAIDHMTIKQGHKETGLLQGCEAVYRTWKQFAWTQSTDG